MNPKLFKAIVFQLLIVIFPHWIFSGGSLNTFIYRIKTFGYTGTILLSLVISFPLSIELWRRYFKSAKDAKPALESNQNSKSSFRLKFSDIVGFAILYIFLAYVMGARH